MRARNLSLCRGRGAVPASRPCPRPAARGARRLQRARASARDARRGRMAGIGAGSGRLSRRGGHRACAPALLRTARGARVEHRLRPAESRRRQGYGVLSAPVRSAARCRRAAPSGRRSDGDRSRVPDRVLRGARGRHGRRGGRGHAARAARPARGAAAAHVSATPAPPGRCGRVLPLRGAARRRAERQASLGGPRVPVSGAPLDGDGSALARLPEPPSVPERVLDQADAAGDRRRDRRGVPVSEARAVPVREPPGGTPVGAAAAHGARVSRAVVLLRCARGRLASHAQDASARGRRPRPRLARRAGSDHHAAARRR